MPTIEQARQWYQNADAVHDFDHVLRVYRMAERLALAEGADLEVVRAAALLHDAEGAMPGADSRANHHHASAGLAAEVLRAEGWGPERIAAVQHCIRAHRYRDTSEPPQTIEAKVLFDADKLDVLGAVGVARVIAYATLAGQPWYAEPSEQFKQSGKEETGEPHSSYHEHLFKLRKVRGRMFTATARAIAEERLHYLDEYFERLIAEWG
ncbi:MAG: HD domain-containing protein [Anaerolineales bacterium]|nr:HD domain-containing protein [Anaerolineales bacterium]